MRYISFFFISTIISTVLYFSLTLILVPAPISAEYWVREMIVIKRSIVKRYNDQQKIIVVSGSNALFNIDAKQLGDELKVPVINFGLHAGLSLKTLLDEADLATTKGDLVILPLEPHYYCVTEPTDWQVKNSIAWDHKTWLHWSTLEKIKAISLLKPLILPKLILAKTQEKLVPNSIDDRLQALNDNKILTKFKSTSKTNVFAYSAYNLDAFGNLENIQGSKYQGVPRSPETLIELCPQSLKLIEKFAFNMSKKGVSINFANPPYVRTSDLNREKVDDSSRQLKYNLSKYGKFLDEKYELVMDRSLFFNSDLHLNSEGRKYRTILLKNALLRDKNFLNSFHKPPAIIEN